MICRYQVQLCHVKSLSCTAAAEARLSLNEELIESMRKAVVHLASQCEAPVPHRLMKNCYSMRIMSLDDTGCLCGKPLR